MEDTTTQLGGDLDTNDKNIEFGDSSGATVNEIDLWCMEQIYPFIMIVLSQ